MTPQAFIENPRWADFLPELRGTPKRRQLPSHEDCSKLDVDTTSSHLLPGGTLGSIAHYEARAGQIDMLKAIVCAYNSREHLMIEAGTGVGKSLAYLVPSILWAWTNDTPVIISTATRNLQSQLINSDIPKAISILGSNSSQFKVALLKGRTNYLCLRALSDFFASGFWTMTEDEQAEMPHFIEWFTKTPDGDLDSYEGLPRNILTCPREECSARRCQWYSRCFVYRARKAAAEAHLVIANHALVLSESTNGKGAILPAYSRIVFDEAHNLEDIATDYLSYEFSLPILTHLLNRVVQRKGRKKKGLSNGLLSLINRQVKTGLLNGSLTGNEVSSHLISAASCVVSITTAADNLVAIANNLFDPFQNATCVRFRVKNLQRQFSVHGLYQFYDSNVWDEVAFRNAQATLEHEIASLVTILHGIRDLLLNAVQEGELNPYIDAATQAGGLADMFVSFANEMNFIFESNKDTHVYWAEHITTEKKGSYLKLVAAPLSIAREMQNLFYDVKDSVILSSATLRVGNDFRYMSKRLGCNMVMAGNEEARFRALTASSPFDYLRQACVVAPNYLPDPASQNFAYKSSLAKILKDLFVITNGRALVLFTSYEMMRDVANEIREDLMTCGIKLLVQGEGRSREAMTEALRSAEKTGDGGVVLFGANSFWEGVDVPGEALSCVVIARLPFAQVGDPIIEARGEKIASEGGSAFRDYALPEAAIKFRQGFGRLIRSKRDRGIVIITDSRIVTKNYGAIFRKSIPASVHIASSDEELIERTTSFLEQEN